MATATDNRTAYHKAMDALTDWHYEALGLQDDPYDPYGARYDAAVAALVAAHAEGHDIAEMMDEARVENTGDRITDRSEVPGWELLKPDDGCNPDE